MGKIKILPKNLINLIAAGEVVERPASALKELIENSIDAGSTQIIVNIEEHGNKLIQVKDDGIGMDKEDAILAFAQHATSKLKEEHDLHKISTLGFRGEALASISSVAGEVAMETKSGNTDAIKISAKNSDIQISPSAQSERGTTISIHNIFENIPARKKFLKSQATELKYLVNTFLDTALPYTQIHFELYHNQKLLYRLTKTGSIKERVFEIWGGNISKNLYDEFEVNVGLCNVKFVLGSPEIAKKTASTQFTYVNDRYIVSKVIQQAVQQAYTGFIHKDLKPVYYIFIHIDPSEIDVNVHPRKLEIKFTNGQEIFRIIHSNVKKILDLKTRTIIHSYLDGNKGEEASIANDFPFKPASASANTYHAPVGPSFVQKGTGGQRNTFTPTKRVQDALSFTEALVSKKAVETSYIQESEKLGSYEAESVESAGIKDLVQVFNTYIVFEKENELVFVDQHAAAEKILFEKMIDSMGKTQTKPLLFPEIVELKPYDKNIVMSKIEEFEKIGVRISDLGSNAIQVTEIPEAVNSINLSSFIEDFLDKDEETFSSYNNYTQIYNNLSRDLYYMIATAACHGSVRAGQKLEQTEMRSILKNLLKLRNPYNCPHGRPVMWRIPKSEIEKNFRRIV